MAYAGYPFPYNADNLLVGAVRILYAPTSVTRPTDISDVIDMVSPYNAKAGWLELGATKESFTYTRSFDSEGIEIQQSSGALFEEVTDISRELEVSVAELNADTLKIIEASDSAVATEAAGANKSAQKIIKFGSFSSLTAYRFAFISQRNKNSGLVEEPSGDERGRFVMGTAFRATLSADDAEIEQDKGNLSAADVTFSCQADPDVTLASESWGFWAFEDAGTIAGA